ncbi:MAG: hypothetical protein DBX59_03680 [Bacillota bacterium]|nr:MAG: hypothetical protein DBX59_03680 [Bacillota bacterium]
MENKELVKNIADYFDYLKSLSLEVSFCDIKLYYTHYFPALVSYNSHTNGYCALIKSRPELHKICIEKQHGLIDRCNKGAFYGPCWAGVEEYVFPVKHDGEVLSFISVSGYRGKYRFSRRKAEAVKERCDLKGEELDARYVRLKTQPADETLLKTLVSPLCDMFELLYLKTKKDPDDKNSLPLKKILTYINNNYAWNITLEEIARECHYSESYVRHVFKEKTDTTIGNYVTTLRVAKAKNMLKNTALSVSEIAADVGYSEPNYFTNVFRKATGVSPKQYRKNAQK